MSLHRASSNPKATSPTEKALDIEAKPAYGDGHDMSQGEVEETLGETHELK